MSRTAIFISSLTLALAFPAIASAHCGTTQGSFAVTCEQGVKVYRHNALSSIPRGITQQQAQANAEKTRQKTERLRIAASERSQARTNALRQRELDIKEFRARVNDRNRVRRSFGGYSRGYTIARPLRVRTKH